MEKTKYLVGKCISSNLLDSEKENSNIEIIGVFSKESLATTACRTASHFILVLEEDVDLGDIPRVPDKAKCWFPIRD